MSLKEQHQQGRVITDYIIAHSSVNDLKDSVQRQKIKSSMKAFIDMYRPHAAREDTVLFPKFKTLITQKEYDDLGDTFEDKENKLFGNNGFNRIVEEVAEIEKELGIYNLAKFTPKNK